MKPNYLPKVPPPKTITLWVRVLTCEFEVDRNIQSVTHSNACLSLRPIGKARTICLLWILEFKKRLEDYKIVKLPFY